VTNLDARSGELSQPKAPTRSDGGQALEVITSSSNQLVKRMRALQQRKERMAERAFVVEGILPVWRAVEQGADIDIVVVAPELLRSEQALELLDMRTREGLPVATVSATVFKQVAERDNPSGLAAIVRMPRIELSDLTVGPGSVYTALFEPSNPGNVGTIVRTVDAIGGAGLILIGEGTDPYHPTAVKASMGTIFAVPVVHVRHWDAVRDWSKDHQLPIITTSAHASIDHWNAHIPVPGVILFGNEGDGLPKDIIRESDLAVRIPMARGGSLNLGVAAAVLLYETRRQTLLA
jgi:TrmH family RNA methyltransferase